MNRKRRSLISIEVLTLMLSLGAVQALAGQSIAGTLREEGRAGATLAGAFVSLIDASDVRVDAAFSTVSGAFLLHAPGPGSYRVHVERIGYADWTSVVYALDRQGQRTVEIAIPREPVVLTTLQVRVTRACVTNPAEGDALADVWAEARKALEMAVWAEGEEELSFDLDEYDRVLMPPNLAVREFTNRHRSRVRLPPFESPAASMLAESGYARFEADTSMYYGPDATVLLSQQFRDTHCFGLRRDDASGERRVALTFEPRPERAVPDIEGSVWLSEETAELRRVDFRYVNVPLPRGTDRRRVGGAVVFDRLPNGPFYVMEWWLRFPIVGHFYVNLRGSDRTRTRLEAYKQTGGSVTAAYVQGVPVFGGAGAAVTGMVRDSTTDEPISDANVTLRDWDLAARFAPERASESHRLAAVTDSTGRFEIPWVPDGTYAAKVERPRWRPLDLPAVQRAVTVKDGHSAPVELFVRPPDDIYRRICPDSPLTRGQAAVLGIAREAATGSPIPQQDVEARWVVNRVSVSPSGNVLVVDGARYAKGTTGESGLFVLCGIPGGQELVLKAAGAELGESVIIDRRIVWQDLFIER